VLGFRIATFSKTGRKIVAMVGFRIAIAFYPRSRGPYCSGQSDKICNFRFLSRDGRCKFSFGRASGLVVPPPTHVTIHERKA
jgi:hypothetical protein